MKVADIKFGMVLKAIKDHPPLIMEGLEYQVIKHVQHGLGVITMAGLLLISELADENGDIPEFIESPRFSQATTLDDVQIHPAKPGESAFGAAWLVTAAWAHPIWSQYWVILVDLTTEIASGKPAMIARPGMTHEVTVYALDPGKPVKTFAEAPKYLTPANHSYQFHADSHDAAQARVQSIVDSIVAKQLSPDTDFRHAWDELFSDGVSLRVNLFERMGATVQ